MPNYHSEERPAFVSFIYLLLLALTGAVVFTILAFLVGFFVFGSSVLLQSQDMLTGGKELGFLKMVQVASTIGTFIVPAFIYACLKSSNPLAYLNLSKPVKPAFIVLAIVTVISSGPFLEWTITVNKQMDLPGFLNQLEQWMRAQENQLEILTMQLLKMDNFYDLLINIIMIAILPAIGEELIFRGCLQKIFIQWTKNYHWGIWLAAITFSAIHLQFFGFIPRMLLGAMFGYFLIWSKSIWIPILAHFVNNATAVISAYVYQRNGASLDKINEAPYSPSLYLYMCSIFLTGALLWYFDKKSTENLKTSTNEGRLD